MKKYSLGGLRIFICFLCLLGLTASANAVLELTFPEEVAINRIQYYWDNTANNSAKYNGLVINSDPTVNFNLSQDNLKAKAAATPPTNKYVFGAEEAFPNSKKIFVRLWDTTRQADLGKYTKLESFDNPTGSGDFKDFPSPLAYKFIKDTPGAGQIVKVEEIYSKEIANNSHTKKLKISSSQTSRTDGYQVEIKGCEWDVSYNGTHLTLSGATGAVLELNSPDYTFNLGDVYTFKVRYKNLWDSAGEWSNSQTYIISGSGPLLLKVSNVFTYNDPADPNRYALTYYQPYFLKSSSATYNTLENLMNAINTALLTAGVADYQCIEVDYYDPSKQCWYYSIKWLDYTGTPAIYHVAPKTGGNPGEYVFPDTSPSIDFSNGKYLYLGFGKISSSLTTQAGVQIYRDVIQNSQEFNWVPDAE